MDIIVCIKQVPGTTKVEVDPVTGVLKRTGVDSKMNPYDLYALETALRLKEQRGGIVRILSMGPPQAAEVIREQSMVVEADMTDLTQIVEIQFPCLLTAEKGIYPPRLPSYRRKRSPGNILNPGKVY